MFKRYLKKLATGLKYLATKTKHMAMLWPELWSLPAALVLWFVSPHVIYFIDPMAATFDTGVLQIFIYAIVGLMLFNGVVFAGIKFNFPALFNWYKTDAGEAFKTLTPTVKVCILLALYLGLLLACVLLAHVMVQPTPAAIV